MLNVTLSDSWSSSYYGQPHIFSTTLKLVCVCVCTRTNVHVHACTHTGDNYATMFMVAAS